MSDYFYKHEANQFVFYRIPQELFTSKFKKLETNAKVLYGILLDRNSLSMENGWYEDDGRVYIYYDRAELGEMLQVSKDLIIRYFKQLQDFNLIEIKRQGQGKANKYYVKKFIETPKEDGEKNEPSKTKSQSQEFQKSRISTSKNLENRIQEVQNIDTNKTKENKTKENKKSVSREEEKNSKPTDGLTDIFDRCELDLFNTDQDLKLFLETVISDLYTKPEMCIKLQMGFKHDEIKNRLNKLSLSHIDRALQKYQKADVKSNPYIYFSKCLLTSVVELGIENFSLVNSVDDEEYDE